MLLSFQVEHPTKLKNASLKWLLPTFPKIHLLLSFSGDGGAVAYAIVSGSDRKFEVDVSTGLVTTVDYLDYETKTTYLMNVSATDQASPFHRGFCTVYVTLLNELDEAVAFLSAGYEASLRENIATGTEVVQVRAQSADNLNQLTYRFDPDTSPAALALFKIDSVTVSWGAVEERSLMIWAQCTCLLFCILQRLHPPSVKYVPSINRSAIQ